MLLLYMTPGLALLDKGYGLLADSFIQSNLRLAMSCSYPSLDPGNTLLIQLGYPALATAKTDYN